MISLNLLKLLTFSDSARGSQTFKQHCIIMMYVFFLNEHSNTVQKYQEEECITD